MLKDKLLPLAGVFAASLLALSACSSSTDSTDSQPTSSETTTSSNSEKEIVEGKIGSPYNVGCSPEVDCV